MCFVCFMLLYQSSLWLLHFLINFFNFFSACSLLCAQNWCLGGNQRDLARQKNMKKNQEHTKSKKADDKDGNKGTSLQERKQRYRVYCLLVLAVVGSSDCLYDHFLKSGSIVCLLYTSPSPRD